MNGLVSRLTHWKSTVAGTVIAAVTLLVFKSFNCHLPSDWIAWGVALLPQVLGALSKG